MALFDGISWLGENPWRGSPRVAPKLCTYSDSALERATQVTYLQLFLENLQSSHEGVILRVNIWSCRHFDGIGCPRCRYFDGMGGLRRLSVRSICRRPRVHGLENQAARCQTNAIAWGFCCEHCQTDNTTALSGRRLSSCDASVSACITSGPVAPRTKHMARELSEQSTASFCFPGDRAPANPQTSLSRLQDRKCATAHEKRSTNCADTVLT